jgi:hypothetical protein
MQTVWDALMDVTEDTIFGVTFIKRTTGETRVMNCRTGVKKHLKGGVAPYSFKGKGLLPVYDLQKQGYRSIPIDGIRELRINGQVIRFDSPEE